MARVQWGETKNVCVWDACWQNHHTYIRMQYSNTKFQRTFVSKVNCAEDGTEENPSWWVRYVKGTRHKKF